MLNVKKMLIKIAEAIATIPTALSDLTDDSTHRTVTDVEKTTWDGKADASAIPTALSQLADDSTHRTVTDAEKATWNGKADASILTDIFKIVEYTHAYTSLAAGAGLYITANDFGASTPSGYRPAAVLTCNSGSAANCHVVYFNGAATGENNMMRIVNVSSAARSYTARITILYVKSSMVAS